MYLFEIFWGYMYLFEIFGGISMYLFGKNSRPPRQNPGYASALTPLEYHIATIEFLCKQMQKRKCEPKSVDYLV